MTVRGRRLQICTGSTPSAGDSDSAGHDKFSGHTVMAKRALITGITGQDGSYLAELLLDKGYEVFGMVRRASTTNYWRIEHLLDRIVLKPGDLLDQLSLIKVIDTVRPRELYNLAA